MPKESKTYLAGVAAAKRLFSERGYDAVSTAEIRAEAGMSNGSLFHHFESKEGIAVAVFVSLVRAYQSEIAEKLGPRRSAADGIEAFIRAHNLWIERDPEGARILFNGHHPSWSEEALKKIRAENQGFGQTLMDWKNNLADKERLENWSLALILAALVGPTQASENRDRFFDEIVIGVLDHDIDLIASSHEDGLALNAELRFRSPDFFDFMWAPRPTFGITYATDSPATNTAYGGLTWTIDIWDDVYTDLFFGLSVHDGNDNFDHFAAVSSGAITDDSGFEKYLGCSVLFREAIEVGYKFGNRRQYAIAATVSHLSHGEILCNDSRNAGMDHWGVRYGYKF
eukprot:s1_g1870.t1